MPKLEEISDDELDMEFDDVDFDEHTPFSKSAFDDDDTSGPARLIPSGPPKTSSAQPTSFAQTSYQEEPSLFPKSGSDLLPFKNLGSNEAAFGPQDQFVDPSLYRLWDAIYPVYFDKNRTHAEGRRVPLSSAVENPMVETIALALRSLAIPVAIEHDKRHPKDWANMGRVRCLWREKELATNKTARHPLAPKIHSRRHLYHLVGEYLKAHPTTPQTPRQSHLYPQLIGSLVEQQAQMPAESRKKPSELQIPTGPKGFPAGWAKKVVGSVLPPNSPALSFEAINGNYMDIMAKQMMQGMGGMGGMLGGGAGGAGAAPGTPAGMPPGGLPAGTVMPGQKTKKIFVRR